jgi:hypothetical protein
MSNYQNDRKNMQYDYGRPTKISHHLVKNKEVEYNPVLSKFVDDFRETQTKQQIQMPLEVKKAKKQEITDTYQQPFDILTLEKNPKKSAADDKAGRRRLLPRAQVDYNIITNNNLDAIHWKGVKKPEPKIVSPS